MRTTTRTTNEARDGRDGMVFGLATLGTAALDLAASGTATLGTAALDLAASGRAALATAGFGPTGLVVIGLAVGNAVLAASGHANAATQEQDPARLAPPARRLVVSLADRRLVLFENGRATLTLDVAIGRESTPTPTGTFTIVSRLKDPTWYGPKQVVAPGPSNPLGNRWIGLSIKSFGIHGTNRQTSVGKAASHGCLRVRKADIEKLFDLVRVGDIVEIRASVDATAEPELAAALGTGTATAREATPGA